MIRVVSELYPTFSSLFIDQPGVPGQAHFRDASEPNQPLHGVGDPDSAQLRFKPARRISLA